MKKLFLSFLILLSAFSAKAQMSEQVNAILQVGDDISVFYGAGALAQALNAAPESGGVITLSSGAFNGVTITKRVKIYGSGFYTDAENDIYPSTISGNITINLPSELEAPHDIYIEGIYLNDMNVRSIIDGLNIVKCSLSSIDFSTTNTRVSIIQSYIRNGLTGGDNVVVKNSYLNAHNLRRLSDSSTILLDHCIVTDGYNMDNVNSIFICQNSILTAGSLEFYPKVFRYCIFSRGSWNQTTGSGNNWFSVNMATLFADANNINYADTRTFELAEPNNYLGSDGTPVGPLGGDYPWDKQPSTPVVKNLSLQVEGTQLKVTYDAIVR